MDLLFAYLKRNEPFLPGDKTQPNLLWFSRPILSDSFYSQGAKALRILSHPRLSLNFSSDTVKQQAH